MDQQYNSNPIPYGQPPPSYCQPPPPYGQPPPPYGQSPPPYGQPPPSQGMLPPYSQPSAPQGLPPPYGHQSSYSQPPPYAPVYSSPGVVPNNYQQAPYPYQPVPASSQNFAGIQGNNFSNPTYPPQYVNYTQIVPVNNLVVLNNVYTTVNLSEYAQRLLTLARIAKIAIFINLALDFLLVSANGGFILVTLFNIFGIWSTNRYSKCLGVTYTVFMCLLMLMRIAIMIILPLIYIIILYGITFVSNIITFMLFIRFLKMIYNLSSNELDQCRMYRLSMTSGCWHRFCC